MTVAYQRAVTRWCSLGWQNHIEGLDRKGPDTAFARERANLRNCGSPTMVPNSKPGAASNQ